MNHKLTVLAMVADERRRQNHLLETGKIKWDCANPRVSHSAKVSVLVEEIGEVARAVMELDNYQNAKEWQEKVVHLKRELIQCAAVSCAWAEGISKQLQSNHKAGLIIDNPLSEEMAKEMAKEILGN